MQSKHNKSRSLKNKIIAPVIAAVLVASSAVPAITAGLNSATAASVDSEATGATNVTTIGNTADNIFWTNATYYDYLTDDEKTNGWLTGIKKYGTGFNGSIDEWYPYYNFNRDVVKAAADSNPAWSIPLYFGNFCDTPGAYDTSGHHSGVSNGYNDATGSYNVTRFNYAANNSNRLNASGKATGLSNMYQSYPGLMQSTLDANGNLMATSTLKAPYFDESQLGDYAKVFKSRFPFRTFVENGVTKYEFDSTNATDNVYFTWNGTTPTKVNYGAGKTYGVEDGIKYFMNPDEGYKSGYGIFPFNNRSVGQTTGTRYIYLSKDNTGWGNTYCYFFNASGKVGNTWPGYQMSTYSGGGTNLRVAIPSGATSCIFTNNNGAQTGNINDITYGAYWLENNLTVHNWDEKPADAGTGLNENLDYGFGIKTEMNFRVPQGGKDDAGNDITFTYSGDDDLWVYITDTTTNQSQLVLDLGGNHKQAEGSINFRTLKSTAKDAYGKGQNYTTDFTYDYSKTYKMSIFYMERGMLESNCKMTFSMIPLGNNVIVTEKIDTTNVNAGIRDAVTAANAFGFDVYDGSTKVRSFDLSDGGTYAVHKDTATGAVGCTTGHNVHVVQRHPSTVLQYTTKYDIYNTANKTGTTSSGTTTTSANKQLLNPSGDNYDFAEVEADYVNTPVVGNVDVSKAIKTKSGASSGTNDTFTFTMKVDVNGGTNYKAYPLTYTVGGVSSTMDSSGVFSFNSNRTVTVPNLPVGATYQIKESSKSGYKMLTPTITGKVGTNGTAAFENEISTTSATITGKKYLYREGDESNKQPYTGSMFNFKLKGLSEKSVGNEDTSSVDLNCSSLVDGDIKYELEFDKAGTYLYEFYEDFDSLEKVDVKNGKRSKFAEEIVLSEKKYLVKIVVSGTGELTVSDPLYYDMGTSTDYATILAQDHVNAEFDNVIPKASLKVDKTDTENNGVNGIGFMLYKVSGENASIEGLSPIAEEYTDNWEDPKTGVKIDGIAYFDGLDIYKDMSNPNSTDAKNGKHYQWYCLVEGNNSSGIQFNPNVKKTYFCFSEQNDEGKYEYKAEYVNQYIKSPAAGGTFTNLFLPVGLAVTGVSALAFMGYAFYVRRPKRAAYKNHGKHFKK